MLVVTWIKRVEAAWMILDWGMGHDVVRPAGVVLVTKDNAQRCTRVYVITI